MPVKKSIHLISGTCCCIIKSNDVVALIAPEL